MIHTRSSNSIEIGETGGSVQSLYQSISRVRPAISDESFARFGTTQYACKYTSTNNLYLQTSPI